MATYLETDCKKRPTRLSPLMSVQIKLIRVFEGVGLIIGGLSKCMNNLSQLQ